MHKMAENDWVAMEDNIYKKNKTKNKGKVENVVFIKINCIHNENFHEYTWV